MLHHFSTTNFTHLMSGTVQTPQELTLALMTIIHMKLHLTQEQFSTSRVRTSKLSYLMTMPQLLDSSQALLLAMI
jgi:hypothetical protein